MNLKSYFCVKIFFWVVFSIWSSKWDCLFPFDWVTGILNAFHTFSIFTSWLIMLLRKHLNVAVNCDGKTLSFSLGKHDILWHLAPLTHLHVFLPSMYREYYGLKCCNSLVKTIIYDGSEIYWNVFSSWLDLKDNCNVMLLEISHSVWGIRVCMIQGYSSGCRLALGCWFGFRTGVGFNFRPRLDQVQHTGQG